LLQSSVDHHNFTAKLLLDVIGRALCKEELGFVFVFDPNISVWFHFLISHRLHISLTVLVFFLRSQISLVCAFFALACICAGVKGSIGNKPVTPNQPQTPATHKRSNIMVVLPPVKVQYAPSTL